MRGHLRHDGRLGFDESLGRFYEDALCRPAGAPVPNALEVDDVDAALCRVWDFGGTIVSGPTTHADGAVTAICRDPAGNAITLVQGARVAVRHVAEAS